MSLARQTPCSRTRDTLFIPICNYYRKGDNIRATQIYAWLAYSAPRSFIHWYTSAIRAERHRVHDTALRYRDDQGRPRSCMLRALKRDVVLHESRFQCERSFFFANVRVQGLPPLLLRRIGLVSMAKKKTLLSSDTHRLLTPTDRT
jgi:hypothetical protein